MAADPRVSEGDFGTTIEFTVEDENGVARDFTGVTLTTLEIKLADATDTVTTLTATLKTPPGADGIFTVTIGVADKFLPDGKWTAWVKYGGSGFEYSTVPVPLTVTNIIGAA